MARVLNDILASFYQKLSDSEAIDAVTLAKLQALFQSGKKLKADDLVEVMSGAKEKRPQ